MPFCKRDKKANASLPPLEIVKAAPSNEPMKCSTNEACKPGQDQDQGKVEVASNAKVILVSVA